MKINLLQIIFKWIFFLPSSIFIQKTFQRKYFSFITDLISDSGQNSNEVGNKITVY